MDEHVLRGLYAITPLAMGLQLEALHDAVEQALLGGARMIQYRDKTREHAQRATVGRDLQMLCTAHHAKFIVNDDVQLAAFLGADGVHLGPEDMALDQARALLGPNVIIGISCADSLERVRAANEGGADYIALGAFYPTANKPNAPHADLTMLAAARFLTSLPLCAIGGITADRAAELIAGGADMIAAVDGVFGQPDVQIAALGYTRHFATTM